MQIRLAILGASLLALAGCATMPKPVGAAAGARVSVVFDRRGEVLADARGYADRATGRIVTADDPVRIASVSKLVTALGVMRLVEAGKLDLDRDVSDWLGWRLRNPAYPETPITLRLLLSHRSSLTDNADYVIPLGDSLENWLKRPGAWDAAHPPGTYFRYTNLNFPVIASVMEKASGERFDALMARIVFRPLGVDACMNWTSCSDAAVARAVVLTDASGKVLRDDLKGARPACPVVPAADGSCDLAAYAPGTNGALFSPQGGVRISMRGLARIGRMMLNGGEGFLTTASLAAIETPLWRYDGANGQTGEGNDGRFFCAYGLAVHTLANRGCRDDPFGDGRRRIGHSGDAYGLRSGLWIDRAKGAGIAFFVTALPDDAPKGRSAFTAAEEDRLRASLALGRSERRPHQ